MGYRRVSSYSNFKYEVVNTFYTGSMCFFSLRGVKLIYIPPVPTPKENSKVIYPKI